MAAARTHSLDPASALVLRRFLVRLGCLLLLDLCASQQPLRALVGMADMAALFTGACAVFGCDPTGSGPINQWDEALAFLGIRCLADFALA